jgi:3-hydroxyacyl-[acyl-carrier-protein] dehydratase|tara:strand:+ start:177 stop:653 length:477 start_codon:yes stop_codon:yes gene_type:complete
MKTKDHSKEYDINYIRSSQQNRYPLLFLDKIIEIKPGKYVKAIKNFTYNEWFFPAHFDDEPNVPGFIQLEVLVQTFIMTFLSIKKYRNMKTNFLDANNTKFRRKIIPGDKLEIKAVLDDFKRGLARGYAEGYVDGEFACSSEFIITIPDILNKFTPKK